MIPPSMHHFFLIVTIVSGASLPAAANEPALVFNRDIRPILSTNCFACHGFDAKQRKAGLRLDTAEGAFNTTESGVIAIKPGDPKSSEVWHRINSADRDEQMPPPKSHKTLTTSEKEAIRRWIEQGATYQKHWAFEPPVRPLVPRVSAGNPIDAFILDRLRREGLTPSSPADRETLLRRVSFDLTGLPPALEEIDAFLRDNSPAAYEKQVDRLLASPQYGERMAAFWLDLARYGDTNGYLHDILRTGWPWRDWVIQAFNQNMPFDRFVVEQVAGDLLPQATKAQVLATAFCRNHLITTEGGTLAAEYLNEYAADRVQTFTAAFLGLNFNCCRCHDHKFDPFTQEDFYSLEAFFNSITEKHAENDQSPAYPPWIQIESPLWPQGEKPKVMVMQEATAPTRTFVLRRGQYDQPDQNRPVSRRPPIVFGHLPASAAANRLGLAQWLASRENPLLARVTVNRFWAQIFGTGLVKSVDDFGVQGEFPTHPELLDFLAREFQCVDGSGSASPWNVKRLMRLIVTSETYRQASSGMPELAAKDPENRLLGRFPRQRLNAEEIRDQALALAGLLAPRLGGPPTFPYQPDGLWEERANEASNTKVYKRGNGESLYRRSLYTFWKRTCPPPFMSVFDVPDRIQCAAKRTVTNTPLQALATLNDEQFLECAQQLAARTLRESKTDDERLILLFRRATGRLPEPADLKTLRKGLSELRIRHRAAPADAEALLRPDSNRLNAKLDRTELASWMLVASVVLNLDETLVRD
jgi:mono/diheme cytochrome c family protein